MTLIKLIGIFITAMGLVILFDPKVAKKMVGFWRQGKNLYLGGLIRVLLGVIFIYYAPHARLPQVIFVLGILALLGGLLIFILGLEKIKAMLVRLEKKPDNSVRVLSLALLAFGSLIIYSA